jgi:hypothetical protein
MEVAQAKRHDDLSLEVQAIAVTATTTASQVTQLVDTVAALTTVTQKNTTSLDELSETIRKLTTHQQVETDQSPSLATVFNARRRVIERLIAQSE